MLNLPRPKATSKVNGSHTRYGLDAREMGSEETGWGTKVRTRTFKSKNTRDPTRMRRRGDDIGACRRTDCTGGAKKKVSLRDLITRGEGRAEPSSYVNRARAAFGGGKGRKCCELGDSQEWLSSYGGRTDPMPVVPDTGRSEQGSQYLPSR
jgi:hypothetical protein